MIELTVLFLLLTLVAFILNSYWVTRQGRVFNGNRKVAYKK